MGNSGRRWVKKTADWQWKNNTFWWLKYKKLTLKLDLFLQNAKRFVYVSTLRESVSFFVKVIDLKNFFSGQYNQPKKGHKQKCPNRDCMLILKIFFFNFWKFFKGVPSVRWTWRDVFWTESNGKYAKKMTMNIKILKMLKNVLTI